MKLKEFQKQFPEKQVVAIMRPEDVTEDIMECLYLTSADAASVLKKEYGSYSPSTVSIMANSGKIPDAKKVGGVRVVPLSWALTHEKIVNR